MLFVDSADKAARFIWTCNAFNVPLLFLADVPGFMIGTQVERQGIIRHGAKMISAVQRGDRAEAQRDRAQGLRRRALRDGGPGVRPDACIALPTASIAVMGPQAAVNAVFYNQLQAIEDPDERAREDRGAARRVRRGHRHPAPRVRARRRRRRPAGGPARRADPPLRARRRQAARVAGQAQPDHAGLSAPRVLILTASIGAGHDLPAEVLASELRERAPQAHVVIADALHEAGPLIERLILGGSLFGSRAANLAFDVEHWLLARAPLVHRAAGRLTVRLIGRRMLALVARERPDVVVSTYPGSTEVFGRLRRAGRLGVPVVAAITDLTSLRFWAHPGVDLHLVTHPESVDEVRAIAGRRAEVVAVRGFNDPAFAVPLDRADARRALDLSADRRLVVVSGGGWGVGDLEGAVAEVLERADADALVLCGATTMRCASGSRSDSAWPVRGSGSGASPTACPSCWPPPTRWSTPPPG